MSIKSALLPVEQSMFREASDRYSLLPSQFFPLQAETPEKALILAVLEDLVSCLVKESSTPKPSIRLLNHLQEDLDYLRDIDVPLDYPLSFSRCCLALDLEPEKVREGILARIAREKQSRVIRRHKTAEYGHKLNPRARFRGKAA